MGVFAVLLVAATALAPVLSSNGTDVSVVSADGTDALYTNGYAAEEIYGPEAYMTGLGFSSFADKLRYYAGLPFLAAGDALTKLGNIIQGTDGYDPPAGAQEEINKFGRQVLAKSTLEKIAIVAQMGGSFVSSDADTWGLTEMHLNRLAEISAGTTWESGKIFDSDLILAYGGIYGLLAAGLYNTQYTLDWAFDEAANRISDWTSKAWSSSMRIKLAWDGGETAYASSRLSLNFATIVTSSAGKQTVYLDTEGMKASIGTDMSNGVWSFNAAGSIRHIESGSLITLAHGYNDVSALPSGWYSLSPGTYAGPFLPSTSSSAAAAQGGAVILCGSVYGYAVPNGDGTLRVVYDGTVYPRTSSLRYGITHDGVTEWSDPAAGHDDYIVSMIGTFDSLYGKMHSLLFDAANAAQVMWRISATAQSSNILLSPSSVIPMLDNVGVDPDQAYSMFLLSLGQNVGYFNTYGEVLKAGQTKISAESLDLYVFGTLFNGDGTIIAENVIFTPYVTLSNFLVSSSKYNQFREDGSIMIWDATAVSASSWIGAKDVTCYDYVLMPKGSYFTAQEIYYQGSAVNGVTLMVKTVETVPALAGTTLAMPDVPEVYEANDLFTIIVVLVTVILVLIGLALLAGKSPFDPRKKFSPVTKGRSLAGKIVLIIAAVWFAAGMLFPEPMVNLILGWYL